MRKIPALLAVPTAFIMLTTTPALASARDDTKFDCTIRDGRDRLVAEVTVDHRDDRVNRTRVDIDEDGIEHVRSVLIYLDDDRDVLFVQENDNDRGFTARRNVRDVERVRLRLVGRNDDGDRVVKVCTERLR